ncbi:uncharacterized protein PHACADRAFT_212233 [Phanerochaete carnosa HHB-10118-sp]|uniref:Peptidase A1 domain-containing protein n=1 Tax=Phanerochaete carnosa (strain HHB-10118-sp) TaxID=650164 RepID=K5WMP9_PHACS|nr:uncharacterized protein PHACADRAFT_212233 [Phanerochaete carnosa HHB-10118-sp]EKM51592.1 hypothetical protein PHACADRAFT_212233 [Phanerochaete carnosa HHB-10118-sp]
MSSTIPMGGRLVVGHARDIIARDRARALKMLRGPQPHGPPRHEGDYHDHDHHHGGSEAVGRQLATSSSSTGSGSSATALPSGDTGVDATDAAVSYTVEVGVGDPPTKYTLIVDTGSSNTWVGALKKYIVTKTSKNTGDTVNVVYGTGFFSGTEYIDKVTISPNLIIEQQSIGVASKSQDFNDIDGILGVGPTDRTQGTVSNQMEVPTVVDNLVSQNTIPTNLLGVFFEPTTKLGALNGELTFGGVDKSKITSDITFVPITTTAPASTWWGIEQSISYGGHTLTTGTTGIVDTGTTLLLLATEMFQVYQKATGGVLDATTGLLKVTQEQYENLQSLIFTIGGKKFEMTANAQIWPRSQSAVIGGDTDSIYLVVSDLGSSTQPGFQFVNGFAFLQRFYSAFDGLHEQVGFATTAFTYATTN